MGKFLIFCRIQLKFCSLLYKNVDTHHESFSSKKSNKKVIAKKPLTNLHVYEMNSSKVENTFEWNREHGICAVINEHTPTAGSDQNFKISRFYLQSIGLKSP